MAGSAGCRLVQIRERAVDGQHGSNRIPRRRSWWVMLSDVCLLSHRTLQEKAYAETKTMTHTVGMVVGVAYMLMWTNHRSAGVVKWLLSTNEGDYRSMPTFLLLTLRHLSTTGFLFLYPLFLFNVVFPFPCLVFCLSCELREYWVQNAVPCKVTPQVNASYWLPYTAMLQSAISSLLLKQCHPNILVMSYKSLTDVAHVCQPKVCTSAQT